MQKDAVPFFFARAFTLGYLGQGEVSLPFAVDSAVDVVDARAGADRPRLDYFIHDDVFMMCGG